MTSKALDYVCIFTGGSIRGAAYVGALRAMEELGVKINCFVGSSVGSVISVFYAAGCTPDNLEEIVNNINLELFKDINLTFTKEFSLSKGEYFLEWLREIIEKNYYKDKYVKGANPPVKFKDLDTNVVILTTDLNSTEVKVFSKDTTPDFEVAMATRISASMPGLLKPLLYEGHMLVDGDLSRSWPIWKLIPNLLNYDSRILEYRLEGAKNRSKLNNTPDFLNAVYTAFSNFAADHVISTYNDRDKFDYIRLDAGEVNITDFNIPTEKKKELYAIGYETTMDFFKNHLLQKRAKLLPIYREIYEEIRKIKSYIEQSKYVMAQNKLAELFIYMYKTKKYTDSAFYDEILEFCELFKNNLTTTFGIITTLKNKPTCIRAILQIEQNLKIKNEELKTFLSKN